MDFAQINRNLADVFVWNALPDASMVDSVKYVICNSTVGCYSFSTDLKILNALNLLRPESFNTNVYKNISCY